VSLKQSLAETTPIADAAYRAGAELGDAHAHHNLAVLLESHGDLVGAERHFRQAAERGALAEAALRDVSARFCFAAQ
jgi:hypothetical protein